MKPGTSLIIRLVLTTATVVVLGLGNAAAQRKTEPRTIARWDVQPTGVTDDLTTVYFVNYNLGFASGKNNTIIRTTDGGKSWKRLLERREGGPEYDQLIFINEKEGWLREPKALLHTTDGGDSWQAGAKLPRRMDYGYGAG